MKNTDKLIAILAIFMLILYVLAVFYAFYLSWKSKEEPGAFKYVLTFITGLVGGIVALGFGVKLPDNTPTNNPPAIASVHAPSNFESKFQQFNHLLQPGQNENIQAIPTKPTLAYFYSLVYILLGMISVVLWVIWSERTSTSISQMASAFLGMASAILLGYFQK